MSTPSDLSIAAPEPGFASAASVEPGRRRRVVGYALALSAGAMWGMTGPISEALYKEGANITEIGFWRVLLAVLGFVVYGLYNREMFRIDRRGLLVIGLGGGSLVALFEVAFQHAISNLGVAAAVTLLYIAPVMITLLAGPLLKERVTGMRLLLALMVLAGVAMTVFGAQGAKPAWNAIGIVGGLAAAVSYAGTTLLARYVVPRYGSLKMLFWELMGGTVLLAVVLPLVGRPLLPGGSLPAWMHAVQPWVYIVSLGITTVVLANFAFFGATKRIDAAPTAVGASCEPVVGSLAAFAIFGQNLTPLGWLGLALVVAGVAGGYLREAEEVGPKPEPGHP